MIGDIIAYAIFGLLVGALARFVLPGRRPMGCLATILAGIAGSFVAGNPAMHAWLLQTVRRANLSKGKN